MTIDRARSWRASILGLTAALMVSACVPPPPPPPPRGEECWLYRFVDADQACKAPGWRQSRGDAEGPTPGLSVFKNLTPAEAETMNKGRAKVRGRTSVVERIPCDRVGAVGATFKPTEGGREGWPAVGAPKHGVLNGQAPPNNTREGFNANISPELAKKPPKEEVRRDDSP